MKSIIGLLVVMSLFCASCGQQVQPIDPKANADFLAQTEKQEGVTKTASGLMYKVLTPSEGTKPTAHSTVEVHYEGKLIDGTIFDSSYKRGASISFSLNGVIAGWTEGLQLMGVGSTYEFTIPGNLAYGPAGTRGIPPNATLVFKVELIAIK